MWKANRNYSKPEIWKVYVDEKSYKKVQTKWDIFDNGKYAFTSGNRILAFNVDKGAHELTQNFWSRVLYLNKARED